MKQFTCGSLNFNISPLPALHSADDLSGHSGLYRGCSVLTSILIVLDILGGTNPGADHLMSHGHWDREGGGGGSLQ